MKIIGILLILFGVLDLVGSFAGYDLWGEVIGVTLPELIWRFSAYIEIIVGYFIMNLGSSGDTEEASD